MTNERKDEEMICGLTADEHGRLEQGLNEIPDTMPPRVVWQRIRGQAKAEGLIRESASRRPAVWIGGVGLAAAVVLAVLVVPKTTTAPQPDSRTEPPITAESEQVQLTVLQALMVQSQQLESDLRSLPGEPRVMRASTAATISELQDRIAAIDYQLSDSGQPMAQENKELFWRERVRLMKSLVQLRYAQAQRTAF